MRSRRYAPLVLLALLASAGIGSAETPEPADLLPFGTLLSLEVRHPERLAREIGAAVKSSGLENLQHRLAKMRDETPAERYWGSEYLTSLGFFFSPEMIAELGRFQGAAVALTGFDKEGRPEVVGLIHAGESNLPGMFMRGQLGFPQPRIVGEVENVAIFQEGYWSRTFNKVEKGEKEVQPPAPPEWRAHGPYIVNLPGCIAMTSSKEAARDVILRYKGKSGQPSLSSSRPFRDAAALRERPGLFVAADVAGLISALDTIFKQTPFFTFKWEMMKAVVEPRALKRIDANLTLHDGNLDLLGAIRLDPAFKSPLVELLLNKPLKLTTLANVPAQSATTFTVGIDDPEAKLKALLLAIDGVMAAQGAPEDDRASRHLETVEKLLGFQIGKDLLGRITEVSIATDLSFPLFIVQARDENAAKWLEETGLPQLGLLATGGRGKVEKTESEGKNVVGIGGLGFGVRLGDRILITGGPGAQADLRKVLVALDKKQTWDKIEKNAATLKAVGDTQALIIAAPRSIPFLFLAAVNPRMASLFLAVDAEARSPETRMLQAFVKPFDELGSLVFRVVREGETLIIQARLDNVRQTLPKVIDVSIDQGIELERQQRKERALPKPPAPDR